MTLARGQLVLYIGANRSGGRISMIEVGKMLDAIEKEAARSGYQQRKDFYPEAEDATAFRSAPFDLDALERLLIPVVVEHEHHLGWQRIIEDARAALANLRRSGGDS